MSQFFSPGGQSIAVSASASGFPMNIQDWSPLGLTGRSPWYTRGSQESCPTPQFKASILWWSAFFIVQLSHPYMTTGRTIALTRWTFVDKVMSLLFNMLSRLVLNRETYDESTWEGHLNLSGGHEGRLLGVSEPRWGEGNGTPLQYSCLENPMDRGAWKAAVHGVAVGRTWLSNFTFTFHLIHWRRK